MAGTWEQIWVPGAGPAWDKQAMPFSLNNTYHNIGAQGPGPNFTRDPRPARPVSAGSSRRMFTETHTLAGTTRPCDDPPRPVQEQDQTYSCYLLPPSTNPHFLAGNFGPPPLGHGRPNPNLPLAKATQDERTQAKSRLSSRHER